MGAVLRAKGEEKEETVKKGGGGYIFRQDAEVTLPEIYLPPPRPAQTAYRYG